MPRLSQPTISEVSAPPETTCPCLTSTCRRILQFLCTTAREEPRLRDLQGGRAFIVNSEGLILLSPSNAGVGGLVTAARNSLTDPLSSRATEGVYMIDCVRVQMRDTSL